MFAFTKLTLARQYMVASLLVLLVSMVTVGIWVGQQIERGVIERTAAITSLYVDSYVSHYLQDLSETGKLDPEDLESLDRLMAETPLGEEIVSFKVWSADNRILYSSDPNLINKKYESNVDLLPSFSGEVTSEISDLTDPENKFERQKWDQLIETYAPIRTMGGERVIAVSEFYQVPDALQAEIRRAQLRSWLVVGATMLVTYLVLAGIVGRASNMILTQQAELQDKAAQNKQLHDRVRRAAARTIALNERFMRRISADLHDGPGQDLALALLRIESLAEAHERYPPPEPEQHKIMEDFYRVRTALESALAELRDISAGLRSPEIESLSIAKTVRRAIRNYERKTHRQVALAFNELPSDASPSVKITLYRILQEALTNGYRHANGVGQGVCVEREGDELCVEITDNGQGFDPQNVPAAGHLGLAGMRERVKVLGGNFSVESHPGQGTKIKAALPLNGPEVNHV
ncbi:MAG: sensor histidine kinase [Anaerolineae bacterium]